MLVNYILPLLGLASSVPSTSAAHLPFAGSKRHGGLDRVKRHSHLSDGLQGRDMGLKNGKRLVRRQTGGNCTAPPASSMPASSAASPTTTTNNGAPSSSPSPSGPTSPWSLVDTWSGNSFFDNFNFWSWDDPTHGDVQYVDVGTAWNNGLISINQQGDAIMKLETTNNLNRPRQSVRVHGNLVYTGGLVLMDARHMPYGCGTWPAWWQNGPNWPYGGEIDILEGVNAFTQNQVSLHTGPGCYMPGNSNDYQTGTYTTGNFNSYDCSSADTGNQGCGVRAESAPNTYGQSFNMIGGGVYAMEWANSGINVWFFPRTQIPNDILDDTPLPDTWGTPMASYSPNSCNPYNFFYDHYNIFDTTLCGDWAGADAVWNYAGYAGQDQSCAAITGYSNCVDYVRAQGSAFDDAFWQVSYVKYFNSTTLVTP